ADQHHPDTDGARSGPARAGLLHGHGNYRVHGPDPTAGLLDGRRDGVQPRRIRVLYILARGHGQWPEHLARAAPSHAPDRRPGRLRPGRPVRTAMKRLTALVLIAALLLQLHPVAFADDSDIFGHNVQPNVLIILDNSGSMDDTVPSGEYNPATTYPVIKADRKSTRLNSSHDQISYAVFCLKKKKKQHKHIQRNQSKRQQHRSNLNTA